MINIDINNLDDVKKSNTLSAVIKADSFFYGVFDAHQLILAKTFSNVNFSDPGEILEDSNLQLDYATISVSVEGRPFLHTAEEDSEVLKYFPEFNKTKIYKELFTGHDVNTYFALTRPQNRFLKKLFGKRSFSLHHLSTALAHQSFPATDQLLAHIEDKNLHIMAFRAGHFQFYNQFKCACKEDYLYYILLVYSQLERDPNVFPLTISGAVDVVSETYQLLYSYIRNIKTVSPMLLQVKSNNPKHYYHNLYATATCG